jgi:hypothetical protein
MTTPGEPATPIPPSFKLVFLCIFGLTVLCWIGIALLAFCGKQTGAELTGASKTFETVCTFGWQSGLGAILGLLGGKATT